ncbi:hypothetical protein P053_01535 [Brucella abortus 01-4165]|uniref:NosR/NirI family protein n=1 Tax=Brucella abortus TaxID=235 RepID=UPI0002CD955C|nr:NosR/NirI family protein [Brucella abortus]ENR95748.1 hypothetical protein B971_03066 [Brucella abortus 84/26]EPG02745.1 hypothetical protein L265_02960 [Brucella abortus 90-0775]EPG16274.1 hypothetical protein L257_02964 [Brucella abortus 82-3893]EPG28802.1 hypothetical protein L253_02961 [Brucella abortus 68-3396P]ERT74743.1 hypothetical protein P053_01535 [Brucella abortus 01-4165]
MGQLGLLLFLAMLAVAPARAADIGKYLPSLDPQVLFQGADSIGEPQGEPPIAPVKKGNELLGYAYLNSDFTNATGYSGKPIRIVVGIDTKGVIRGFKLVDHKEPIVLIGIPEPKVVAALNSLVNSDMTAVAAGQIKPPQVEIVSGATVTVLVMGDSVVRSAVGLIRSGRLGNAPVQAVVADAPRAVNMDLVEEKDWQTLIGDGSVRSLKLTVGEVTQAFRDAKHDEAAANPETADPEDEFIELYVAPASVPSIGISLLGKEGYERLRKQLKPGQQAILVAGDGAYSFKGSGYVRGGIFDRIELMQDSLVRHPRFFTWLRRGYLLFILVWLGFYNNAQLSVVNVLTFTNSLITGFNWEFFLTSPLIFILWGATAAGLLFWGRGPFCGWLCPFGALQELTNNLAQWLKVPQVKLPWGLHERLWPLKYIIFLGLFALSLYSMALAELFAEVEPFKTSIILKFARDWPFVIYALTLLAVGLFVERFYCRYLCPLGAALAIPGRIRMFEWLKRWQECGSPCQRCAKECPVEAIHPEGQINVNECIYCMHCQELYHDDQRCPHMIQVRVKREKFAARNAPLAAAAERGGGPARPIISVKGKPVETPVNPGPAA